MKNVLMSEWGFLFATMHVKMGGRERDRILLVFMESEIVLRAKIHERKMSFKKANVGFNKLSLFMKRKSG